MMLLALILAAVELVAPPPTTSSPQVVGFTMADTKYLIPVPQGYCLPDFFPPLAIGETSTAVGSAVSNVAYWQLCDDNLKIYDDKEFIQVRYFKTHAFNSISRQELLASVALTVVNEEFTLLMESGDVKGKIDPKAEQNFGRTITADALPEKLGSDDTCIYGGSRISLGVNETRQTETAKMVVCTTLVDKALVSVVIVENEKRGESFPNLARKVKAVVHSIIGQ